jgi:hypothetical protein
MIQRHWREGLPVLCLPQSAGVVLGFFTHPNKGLGWDRKGGSLSEEGRRAPGNAARLTAAYDEFPGSRRRKPVFGANRTQQSGTTLMGDFAAESERLMSRGRFFQRLPRRAAVSLDPPGIASWAPCRHRVDGRSHDHGHLGRSPLRQSVGQV